MQIKNLKIEKIAVMTLMAVLVLPIPLDLPDFGENTDMIINEVSIETNTGGNSANGGVIEKGNASASAEVRTEANGEEIEKTEIKIETEGDESIEKETKTENGVVRTKVDVKVNAEESGILNLESGNEDLEVNPPAGGENNSLGATINQIWQKVVSQLITSVKHVFKLFL